LADRGVAWRQVYESADFEAQMKDLMHEMLPFYEQLHTYVRRRLRTVYPNRFNTSAIPAHLLGNM
jgi:hypothetical protein